LLHWKKLNKSVLNKISLSLFLSLGTLFSAPDSLITDKNVGSKKNKKSHHALLILKKSPRTELKGDIKKITKNGVFFDQVQLGLFYNPKEKYYPFNKIKKLIAPDGTLLYDATSGNWNALFSSEYYDKSGSYYIRKKKYVVYPQDFFLKVASGFGKRRNGERYREILLSFQNIRNLLVQSFAIGFRLNTQEGFGCCECPLEEGGYYKVHFATVYLIPKYTWIRENHNFSLGIIYVYSHPGWCDLERPFNFLVFPSLNFEMFTKSDFNFTMDLLENIDHMKFGDIFSAGIKHDLRRHSQYWLGYTLSFETWSISGKYEIMLFKRFRLDLHGGYFPRSKGFDLRVGFGLGDF